MAPAPHRHPGTDGPQEGPALGGRRGSLLGLYFPGPLKMSLSHWDDPSLAPRSRELKTKLLLGEEGQSGDPDNCPWEQTHVFVLLGLG